MCFGRWRTTGHVSGSVEYQRNRKRIEEGGPKLSSQGRIAIVSEIRTPYGVIRHAGHERTSRNEAPAMETVVDEPPAQATTSGLMMAPQ